MIINLKEMKESTYLLKSSSVELVHMIVYKPYYNGNLCVRNVPYTIKVDANTDKKERVREEYLTHDVFEQLALIFEYMEQHGIKQLDYQGFLSINQLNRTKDSEEKEVKKSISLDDRNEVITYVMKEWIDKYFEMSLRVSTVDQSEQKNVEEMALISNKLDYFHDKLNKLPELHHEIIKRKFLQLEKNGRYPIDDFVYTDLHIGRTYYYRLKKEALYWLGLSLLDEFAQ